MLIVSELRRARPHDAIVGEEGASQPGSTGLEWHLDPIDGTVNFVYDLPTWCTSVGVLDANGAVAGAVYVPVLDELFSAARGCGATLNGEPIATSTVSSIDLALVGTGFSYSPQRRREQAARVATMLPLVRDVRRFGSAAIDLCLVACGRLDAYFEQYLNSWDMAAGVLIAAEAGATCSDFARWRAVTRRCRRRRVPDPLGTARAHRHAPLNVAHTGSAWADPPRVRQSHGGSGIMGVWVHASWPSKTMSASAQR